MNNIAQARNNIQSVTQKINQNFSRSNWEVLFGQIFTSIAEYSGLPQESLKGKIKNFTELEKALKNLLLSEGIKDNPPSVLKEELTSLINLVHARKREAINKKFLIDHGYNPLHYLFGLAGIDLTKATAYTLASVCYFMLNPIFKIRTIAFEVFSNAIDDEVIQNELDGLPPSYSFDFLYNALKSFNPPSKLTNRLNKEQLLKQLQFSRDLDRKSLQLKFEYILTEVGRLFRNLYNPKYSQKFYEEWTLNRFRDEAYDVEERIANLEPGETALIPGGWVGHCVIYEVKRERESNSYTFITTNTGDDTHLAHMVGRGIGGVIREAFYQVGHYSLTRKFSRTAYTNLSASSLLNNQIFSSLLFAKSCGDGFMDANVIFPDTLSTLKSLKDAGKRKHLGNYSLQKRGSCGYSAPRTALMNLAKEMKIDKEFKEHLRSFAKKQLATYIRRPWYKSIDPRHWLISQTTFDFLKTNYLRACYTV